MSTNLLLGSAEAVKELARRLDGCEAVKKLDGPGHWEAGTLAHALADLERTFWDFLSARLPRLLMPEDSPEQIRDVLLAIGEDLRHIQYHIQDPRFFAYLPGESAR